MARGVVPPRQLWMGRQIFLRMTTLPAAVLLLVCLVVVLTGTVFGLVRGRRVRREFRPENEHLGTIQSGLMGLLALLLGFAFAGAMSRFIDRQDALAREANAIETAYHRASLLPTAERVRSELREYAKLRLELFRNGSDGSSPEIMRRLQARYEAALSATMEGVRAAPAHETVAILGIEAVDNEFATRNAIARRHLPFEFVLVMLACSCVTMGTIGFGVGVAERRSVGSVIALAVLVATTLFMTFDFDRPRDGLIRLDPTPLEEMAQHLAEPKKE